MRPGEKIPVDKNNPKYDSRNNCNAIIETKTNKLICGCANTVIPDSINVIDWLAFHGQTSLTSIVIPNSVKRISSSAFGDCSGLVSLVIPESVT